MMVCMQRPTDQRRFTVTALFSPMPAETSFLRKDWPAHVTLAGNFVTEATTEELVLAVRSAGVLTEPTVIHFGGEARFGPNQDVVVRLVLPGRVLTLHQYLADQFEQLPGFAADDPSFWRVGYHPHLTLGSAIFLQAGEAKEIGQIAIAQLSGERATIAATFDLPTQTPPSRADRGTAGDTSSRG
jgi:hypothetical protein